MRLIWVLWLAACAGGAGPGGSGGGDGGDGGDSDDGGGGNNGGGPGGGGGTSTCPDVCWTWSQPTAPAPIGVAAPAAVPEYTFQRCNAWGLTPGRCPDDFTCGSPQTLTTPYGSRTTGPFCEGSDPPYEISAELAPDDTLERLAVTLTFTVSGQPWPAGQGYSGKIVLRGEETGESLQVPMPIDGGPLQLRLPADTYAVTFSYGEETFPYATWPLIPEGGELIVTDEGEEVIDVPARPVQLALFIDDVRQRTVPEDAQLIVSWRSEERAQLLYWLAGEAVSQRVWLYDGVWDAHVRTDSAGSWPVGGTLLAGVVTVEGDQASAALRLRTVPIGGTVRVDGATVARFDRAYVELRSATSEVRLEVADDSTFSARVYDDVYDLTLQHSSSDRARPDGSIQLQPDLRPREGLALAPTTVAVDGELTLNGAPLVGGTSTRSVSIHQSGSSATVRLYESSPRFAGRAWPGAGAFTFEGDGLTSPLCTTTLAAQRTPTTGMRLDMAASRVELDLRVDGAAVPLEDAWSLMWIFRELDPATGELRAGGQSCTLFAPAADTLALDVWLPRASWLLSMQNNGADNLPLGGVVVAELDASSAIRRRVDLWTHEVTIGLLLDGAPLPPSTGSSRGVLTVGQVYQTVPPTRASRATLRVWDGSGDVSWSCTPELGCLGDGLPHEPGVTLWSGLEW